MTETVQLKHGKEEEQKEEEKEEESLLASIKAIPPRGIMCIIGGFIVCLCFGSDFSYGNLNTYVTPYMRQNGYNPDLNYGVFIVALPTAKMILQGLCMPGVGLLVRKLSARWAIGLGVVIYSVGYHLTALTVKYHFALAVATLALHGIAFCFIYATSLGAAQGWGPKKRKGLIASIVVSGYGFGSMIWAPIQTYYSNPNNINAVCAKNATITNGTSCTFGSPARNCYFKAEEILERIPSMFTVLGSIYVILGLISVILISDPPSDQSQVSSVNEDKPFLKTEESPSKSKNLAPLQVMRKGFFYQIWFGFFAVNMTIAAVVLVGKPFSQKFIYDDHFFANIAIVSNLLNGFSRIGWGFCYDRFGFKKCFTCITMIVSICILTFPLLSIVACGGPMLAKTFYSVWTCVLYATFPGIYSLMAGEVCTAFGPLYYQANFGLLYSQYLLYALIMVFILKVIIPVTGLSFLFYFSGSLGLISVLVMFTGELWSLTTQGEWV